MASQYEGDPTATQTPSPPPSDGEYPIGVLPEDGDARNASSVNQAFKTALDFTAYLSKRVAEHSGIQEYDSLRTYTAGMVVRDPNGSTYRVKAGQSSVGILPNANTTKWERYGHSTTELNALFVYEEGPSGLSGRLTLPSGHKFVWALTTNLPANGTDREFDLPFAFSTIVYAAWASPKSYSSGFAGSPQLFVMPSILGNPLTQLHLISPATGGGVGKVDVAVLFAFGV